MKLIKTEDAVGQVLCHDITQIIKGVTKDAVFCKGHIVTEEDIPVLLSCGKENLYVWEKQEGMLHENEAAEILRKLCQGANLTASEPKEGKINLTADIDGLFRLHSDRLQRLNSQSEIVVATRHGDTCVKQGDIVAGMRVVPLVIDEKKMEQAAMDAGQEPLLSIIPFQQKKAAILTTGSEVYHGRIKDTFTPVVIEKLQAFDTEIISTEILDDQHELITEAIREQIDHGADLILCTGGMSVDPDDRTPLAIKNTGAEIITYGAPVLPGAMFLLSYYDGRIPIVGLPGCVMYAKRTVFDLVLPRLMADVRMTREDFTKMGEGGLCLGCDICTYPNCGFGK